MVNRDAPYSGLSNLMAMQGRYGDTELVHMSKPEIQGLASLGQLTINPETGLPEAFSLKALLPAIGGLAGSILLPGIGTALGSGLGATAIGAGLGTTAGGLLAGQKPGEALLSGVMSGVLSFGIGSLLNAATPGLTETTGGFAYGEAAQSAAAAEAAFTGLDDVAGGLIAAAPTVSGAPTVAQALTPNVIAPVSYSAAGVPQLAQPAVDLASASGQRLLNTAQPGFFLEKAVEPSFFGKLMGKETIPAGDITREQFIQLGGTPSDATFKDIALQKAKNPLTYLPLGIAATTVTAPANASTIPAARPAPDTGFDKYTLEREKLPRPADTEEGLTRIALKGGRTNYFTLPRYVAEGGLVGLQQGGMPMAQPQIQIPQQQQQPTSAMAAMIQPPVAQQPVMVQPVSQPQPQQQMPTPTPEAVQPFDPMQQYRQAYMEVEGERSRKNTASALQQVSVLGAMAQQVLQQDKALQGVTPQNPYVPPTNYGSQVNLGAGFNQGGLIRLSEGGQSKYFEGQVEVENGDGMSDEVLFDVEGDNPDMALLSRDEYVLPADVVAMIGNGSSNAGADKLDDFVKDIREVSFGTRKQQKQMNAEKGLQTLVS